ncbi:AAA family ATPase [Ruminococcus sp.]|uniref:AAA family ATPase n=1 Tax=Ruminococcus sp. TaxID=41978 RepID=UPI001B52A39C|nr:AAA family ATPase [Ruminococcus sp.]MBP5432668.1 AAA family ATPase [Ruminococcus sp.]
MDLSKEALDILYQAMEYAKKRNYEFVTPELLLLMMLRDRVFTEAFEECGGNAGMLEDYLKEYAEEYMEKAEVEMPELSDGVNMLMNYAAKSAYSSGSQKVHLRHIIHGLWNLDDCYAIYFMEKQGIAEADLLQEMAEIEEYEKENETGAIRTCDSEESQSGWRLYAPCLNDTLRDTNPLIGREAELDRTIQILCRKEKNNPLHIGEPGVGKTAITYGLVQLINSGMVPEPLAGARIFALDLGGMLAGTQYRGDFEKRFKKVLSEIGKEEKPIIYIDEIHNLSGAGAVGEGSFDASNMLKPYLADGRIRFIGATTFEEYKKYFEKNKSLVRRFQNVEIKEPTEDETVEILEGLRQKYESFHGVKYAKGVLRYAVSMSAKYINERFLPDKAIDLIDEAGAYVKLHPMQGKLSIVDKNIINQVLTTICRVPVETVATDEVTGLAELEGKLKAKIFGQDEAVAQVVNAVKYSKAGLLDENKPLASLLFVGPTGVGKTEIAKRLAEELGVKLIRFDMSEYGEKHAVAKLIGSPAGYVGYEDGGLLTEAVRKSPSAVLLLDEIEKAHSDIYNVLLQVMDYATLTDNQGRKADFRNVIIIMTSNAGANRIGKSTIGFQSGSLDSSAIMEAVKQTFQPEFRNRLNKIVVFNGMDDAMAERVVDKKLGELAKQLEAKKTEITVDRRARELVKEKGISREFGAREIDRVIRNDIKPLFVDELLFGKLKKGGAITLTAENDNFNISVNGNKGGKQSKK